MHDPGVRNAFMGCLIIRKCEASRLSTYDIYGNHALDAKEHMHGQKYATYDVVDEQPHLTCS